MSVIFSGGALSLSRTRISRECLTGGISCPLIPALQVGPHTQVGDLFRRVFPLSGLEEDKKLL